MAAVQPGEDLLLGVRLDGKADYQEATGLVHCRCPDMRIALLLLVPLALPALADNTLTDRDRQLLAARKAAQEAQVERARARCVEQRGVDCTTLQGLQEWM